MSYIVLARKYRPQTFNELIGQPHIKETLSNAITTNRLAHAYLFAGSRGTGKTTTARILAKCLNCLKGISISPCNECSSCREIAGGYSMDVLEIDGASNRGIDEIRELRERVKFLPAKAKYKVYIIDEVHMLTAEAFNALLKTLEEPPEHVIFIFATTEPHKVPQTILSRCQRFDFKRISVSEICKLLKKIAEQEKIEIDDSTLTIIAKAAEGSMRDAESILDQVVSFCGNKVSQKDVLTILGIIRQEILSTFCDAIIENDSKKIIKLLNDVVDEGINLSQLVRDIMAYLCNLLLIKTGCTPDFIIHFTSDNIKLLEMQAKQFDQEQLLNFIEILQKANENMRIFPSQAKLILEVTLIRITTQGDKKETITSPPKSIDLGKQQDVSTLTIKDSTNRLEYYREPGVSINQIKEIWTELRGNIKKEKPSLDICLAVGEIVDLVDHTITIGFREKDSFHRERIEKRENKEFIEEQIKKMLNCEMRIKTIVIDRKSSVEGEIMADTKRLNVVLKIFPEAEVIKEG